MGMILGSVKYSPGVKFSYMLYKINYFKLRATFEIGILETWLSIRCTFIAFRTCEYLAVYPRYKIIIWEVGPG